MALFNVPSLQEVWSTTLQAFVVGWPSEWEAPPTPVDSWIAPTVASVVYLIIVAFLTQYMKLFVSKPFVLKGPVCVCAFLNVCLQLSLCVCVCV